MNQSSPEPPVVSVIVPMYNIATYLKDCLDSLAAQNIEAPCEIIVIDDASTDNSIDQCRAWMRKNPGYVDLFENPSNRGVSFTRNRGLELANGKYFTFVDPDDLLPSNALSSLYRAAETHSVDIVKGNNTIFSGRGEYPARYNVDNCSRHESGAVLSTLFQHEKLRGHPWGKLFRRDRLGHFRFPEGVRMAQDLYYCCEVFAHARSLVLIDAMVYRYRNHASGSTGRKFSSGSYLDWLDAVEASGRFAVEPAQRRAHRNLMLRTLNQLARETRALPPGQAPAVLAEIERRCERWDIRLPRLLFKDRLGPRSLARYIKMRQAIRQARGTAKPEAG